MDNASMVRCAHELVRTLKEDLARTRSVEPVFILLGRSSCDYIVYEPALFGTPDGRQAIAGSLRRRARETGAQAALIGMDSRAFVPDLEALGTANEKLVRAAADAGIEALVRCGFGRQSEALSVVLQTPGFHLVLQQLYTRGAGNSIVFDRLLTIDTREYPACPVATTGLFDVFTLDRTIRV